MPHPQTRQKGSVRLLQCRRILLTCFRARMSVHELGSMSLGQDPRKLDALKLVYVMVLAPEKEPADSPSPPCGKLDLCFPSHNRNSADFPPEMGCSKRHVLGCVNREGLSYKKVRFKRSKVFYIVM